MVSVMSLNQIYEEKKFVGNNLQIFRMTWFMDFSPSSETPSSERNGLDSEFLQRSSSSLMQFPNWIVYET
jgi:hypothetical protein